MLYSHLRPTDAVAWARRFGCTTEGTPDDIWRSFLQTATGLTTSSLVDLEGAYFASGTGTPGDRLRTLLGNLTDTSIVHPRDKARSIARGSVVRDAYEFVSPSTSPAAWFDANSLSPNSQFWYDESEYYPYSGYDYLRLPGTSGSYASLADAASLDITGDIDVCACIQVDSITGTQTIIGKYDTTLHQRAYWFKVGTAGYLEFGLSSDGTYVAGNEANSGVAISATTSPVWVRATWVAATKTITFYTSTNAPSTAPESVSWTQLGSTGTTLIGSIYNSTAPLIIGGRNAGTADLFKGRIYRAAVFNGVAGTKVADFVPSTYLENSWTLTGQNLSGEYMALVTGPTVPRYRATFGSSSVADTADPVVRTNIEIARARVQASSNQHYSYPVASTGINFAQDFDVNFRIAANDWSAAGQGIIGQWTSAGDQRSWGVDLSANTIVIYTTTLGTAASIFSATSSNFTTVVSAVAGEFLDFKIRFRHIGGTLVATFQTKPINDSVWSDFGRATFSTGIFTPTTDLLYGARFNGSTFDGQIATMSIVQGDTTRVSFDPAKSGGWTAVNSPRLIAANTENYLLAPGVVGNYASIPTATYLNVSTGLELVARIRLNDWTPTTAGGVISRGANITLANTYALNMSGATSTIQLAVNSGLYNATATPPVSDTSYAWVKATWRSSDGRVQFFTAPDQVSEPTSWTQLGADVVGTTTPLAADTAPLHIGTVASGGTSYPLTGRIKRVIVRNGAGGTTLVDVDFTNKSGNTFVEASANAATVTINRSTTGSFAHIIDRTLVMSDGTDDLITLPTRSNLSLNGSSFTSLVASFVPNEPAAYGRLFSAEGTGSRWAIYRDFVTPRWGVLLGDGTTTAIAVPPAVSFAIPSVFALISDRSSNVIRGFANGSVGADVSTSTVLTTANTNSVGISAAATPSLYLQQIVYGACIIPRVLSTSSVNAIGRYFVPGAF